MFANYAGKYGILSVIVCICMQMDWNFGMMSPDCNTAFIHFPMMRMTDLFKPLSLYAVLSGLCIHVCNALGVLYLYNGVL